jgi:transposase-like protein
MARRAVETCFPRALRQRCLVHRLRNLHSKAPDSLAGDRDSGARDELMSRMTTEEHGEMYELLTKMREIQEAAAARSAAPPASHLTSPR